MTIHEPLLTNKTELRFFGALALVLVALIIITGLSGHTVDRGGNSVPSRVVTNYFEDLDLKAKAAYVYDARTGNVLFAKNASARLPLASLTKVMSAVVATDLAPGDSVIVVTKEAISADGDSGLRVGERWSLKNLLDFALTSSSNDGTKAVALALGAIHKTNPTQFEAEQDFIANMNKKADDLHMKNTYYFNETGLDLPAQAGESVGKGGAYGSAEDMAKLLTYILKNHPELLDATRNETVRLQSLDNFIHTAHNTDTIVANIPGIKASKTGFTDLAGGNLVIAFDPELGRPIIISVLGSTADERFTDVSQLVEATFKTLSEEIQK
ncbi:MAG: hypothetical protein JWN89_131 [Parcubacteria group bacterium]|nr:hypothetical protein [Parcubacteria group bacterium]